MVSGRVAALARGSAVSQCADTTRIASGRGRLCASSAHARVSLLSSTASVGAPCERKATGSKLFPGERDLEFHPHQGTPHLQPAADTLVVPHLVDLDRLALVDVHESRVLGRLDALGCDRNEFLPRRQVRAELEAIAEKALLARRMKSFRRVGRSLDGAGRLGLQ